MKLRNRNNINAIMTELQCDNIFDQSTPSYCFKGYPGERKYKIIAEVFGIPLAKADIKNSFIESFRQATNGAGHEADRITTLHSSSLLALLCFYQVSVKGLSLTIGNTEYNFSKVFFERENYVGSSDNYPKDRPSSIDVVLWDEDKETLLYLESKFTEPLNGASEKGLAEKYMPYFDVLKGVTGMVVDKINNNVECKRVIEGGKEAVPLYVGGIKQMIAHYLGVISGPVDKPEEKETQEYINCYHSSKRIILGTILMDSSSPLFEGNEGRKIDAYSVLYSDCMKQLSLSKEKITVLSEPLTYQQVFGGKTDFLDPKVAMFYKLNENPAPF